MTTKDFLDNPIIDLRYLATKAGISYGSIRHYVCGSKQPGQKSLIKLNKAINEIGKELSNIKLK